jgi:hypothetical protein
MNETAPLPAPPLPPEPPPFAPDPPKRGRGRPRKDPPVPQTPGQAAPPVERPQVTLQDVQAAWAGVWTLLCLCSRFFGYESDAWALSAADLAEDARGLLPLARRLPWAVSLLGWVGGPILCVQRVREHFKKKPDTTSNDPKGPPCAPGVASSPPTT